ncbi:hypothetical protein EDB87DRAFT_1586637 [Lactarius vividus]|nr:hypothetical protein EDB87DRAFT_1586637 [Lactarius vividus]
MVIDWEAIDSEPTDTAAVIERALLLNDAAIRDPRLLSTELSPLTSASQSTKRRQLETPVDLPSVEDPCAEASRIRGPSSIPSPSADGRRHGQIQTTHLDTGDSDSVHTPTPIDCFPEGVLRDTAFHAALLPFSSSPHPRSPMRHQTTNNTLLHPTPPMSQMRTRASSSQSTRLLHGHSSSPQSFSSPPPSQTALDTLHHILQLKRQISRSSSSTGPPAVSPSPSCPSRKLYPASKEPQSSSPSKKRHAESSADAVAAALNESARLSQGGTGRASASSTPLRVYKKRRLLEDGQNLAPRSEPGRRERVRDSLSPAGHSSPPIAALGHDTGSPPGSPLTELTPSLNGDELDLSYPPSPKPPILGTNSDHPSAPPLTESLRPVEPSEPVAGASLLNLKRLPSEEKDALESAGLQYLTRYYRTFDTDRRALGEAYAPDATFSCPSRSLCAKGRDGILDALTMLGHGFLCSESKLKYEVSFIPGIGTLLAGAQDEEVGYSMNFVLQPRDHEDREPERDTEQWPLVAIMHQVVFREGS